MKKLFQKNRRWRVKPKILSLRHDLAHFDCDICVLSETWLKPETLTRYVNFPGYKLTTADRSDGRGYGGLPLAILSRVDFSVNRITGGGGGEFAPRLVCLLSTENGLTRALLGLWIFHDLLGGGGV